MRKTTLLLGAGMGFILGSRAGRGPYEQLEDMVRKVTYRPDVQDKFGQIVGTARGQAAAVAKKVAPSQLRSDDGGVTAPAAGREERAPAGDVPPKDDEFRR